jgi:hypothetical protein
MKEAARTVCACAHRLRCEGERERLGFLVFIDDEPKSATYGHRVQDCPGCGERLGLLALFAAGPSG